MEKLMIECPECFGEKMIEGMVTYCSTPISRCCGGCTKDYPCETCDGEGEVDLFELFEDDLCDLVDAFESLKKGCKDFDMCDGEIKVIQELFFKEAIK